MGTSTSLIRISGSLYTYYIIEQQFSIDSWTTLRSHFTVYFHHTIPYSSDLLHRTGLSIRYFFQFLLD